MRKFKKMMYLKVARAFSEGENDKEVPTIISETTKVHGDIESNGILQVDGCVEGDVTCTELDIGVKGSIIGTVKAKSMHLYGTLQGKAIADNLFVAKTAKIVGDVAHNSIAIEPGASIDGYFIKLHSENNSILDAKTPQIGADIKESEFKETEAKDSEVKDAEVKETEVKDAEVQA